MATEETHHSDDLQRQLRVVQELLARHSLSSDLAHRPDASAPSAGSREALRQIIELQRLLDAMHPADIAFILEALPLDDRLFIWERVRADRDGEILLEVSDAVRESLIEAMAPEELKAAAESLDADELADLVPDLPPEVVQEVYQSLDPEGREQLRAAMSYAEDTVGALMDFDMVTVREDVTLEVVLRYLRRFNELPDHTDKLFVVDRDDRLRGLLTLENLLINDVEQEVRAVMQSESVHSFSPEDDAGDAAQAFERYDLVSAPVIDADKHVVGRLTVAEVVDYIREQGEQEILNNAGLREEEDIFAPIWASVKNRWGWLAINMVTAIVASRVIGLFEGSIEQLVALAALMPIIAGIGGNSGNQTITMIVRAIAMGQIETSAMRRLLRKEIGVALVNGAFWGGFLGLMAWWLYGNPALGIVMTAAMILNLLLAATAGVLIPIIRTRLGRDPALGSSVMITGLTDSGGFFIFLGLATIFLL